MLFQNATDVPAINDRYLTDVLEDLELLEPLRSGQLRCPFCETGLNEENVGGIVVGAHGHHRLLCDDPLCIGRATRQSAE